MGINQDEYWMRQALEQAQKAALIDEVPVGAVLVANDQLVTMGHNHPIAAHDPSAHAEMVVLRQAGEIIQNYRLLGTTLYVTLEPCMMCCGLLIHARIERLVFGAFDLKAGAVSSVASLLDAPYRNHTVRYEGGVLKASCGQILSDFFSNKRKK